MKFTLRAESPIHVGSGESLSWLDYMLIGRTVHVLDWGALLDAALLGCADAPERLAAFTDRCARLLQDAQDALAKAPPKERSDILRRARDETSPVLFAKDDLGNDVLARALKAGDYDKYQAEYVGGRLDRRLEIRVQAKDARGRPTIPASVLRGQIRSALAHAVLSAGDPEIARVILEGGGGLDGWNRSLAEATPGRARFLFGEDVEAAVFRAPGGDGPGARGGDARLDLLRFVRFSDPIDSRAELIVLRSSPFALSRAGAARSEPARLLPVQPAVFEAINEGAEFEFEIRVDTAVLQGAAGAAGAQHPLVREPFWRLFQRVYGVSREEARNLSAAALEERMLSALEVSLASRAAALCAREQSWLDRANVSREAPPRQFLAGLEQRNDGRLPLRIGSGSGLHGMTVLPAIETDARLAEPLARVLARAGLGLKPRDRRERAEREKNAIEQARRDAAERSGPRPRLREDLLTERRDPRALPAARRFTMEGGAPDLYLGFATLARGTLSVVAPPAKKRREERPEEPRPEKVREPRPKKPARPQIPDRPASQSEIEDLLRKFGPRH